VKFFFEDQSAEIKNCSLKRIQEKAPATILLISVDF
jgi:hypothetical protein